MELGSMTMFGSVYTEHRQWPMEISIGSVVYDNRCQEVSMNHEHLFTRNVF